MILLYPWYNVVLIYITRRLKVRKSHFLEVFHYPLKTKHSNNFLSLFEMHHYWVRGHNVLLNTILPKWAVLTKRLRFSKNPSIWQHDKNFARAGARNA